ncbi:MAG: hypothetical protein SO369_04080 [Treponema sp.]|nr:hypothetical protein [Treponema sp.]
MSIHNKKTARLLQGVALGLIIISATLFLGCENPVGGAEQNPIEELVGKVYKGDWETFSISQDNTGNIILTINDIIGKIIESKTADIGTVYLLQCSNHTNYGPNQYPGYNTGSLENPHTHSNCYTLVHVRSSSTDSIDWATFITKIGMENEGEYGTACFDSNSLSKAKEYLDFSKWDEPYSYSTGIAQN